MMSDQDIARELNALADTFFVPRVEPGSPLAELARQAKRFEAMMRVTEPTRWNPSECQCRKP
jgi:hypothetical protein